MKWGGGVGWVGVKCGGGDRLGRCEMWRGDKKFKKLKKMWGGGWVRTGK